MNDNPDVTTDDVKKAMQIVLVVAEAIKELGSVPSGHLYAQLMSHMTLDTYTKIIGILKKGGMVTESGHLLTWVGP
jgi:hypothetical protein